MIESYFDESPPGAGDEPSDSKSAEAQTAAAQTAAADADDSWLDALREVKRVARRKSFSSWHREAADLVQEVALRLFKWRKNHENKSRGMSPEEWQRFAAGAARNEIRRRHAKQTSAREVPFDEAAECAAASASPEGNSIAERASLARAAWQEICTMTLRQRRALLFFSQQLHVLLLESGIRDEEIAAILEMSLEKWIETQKRTSLSDSQIADLINEISGGRAFGTSTRSVKKARAEARIKLRRITDK
jgi:DNA-directed RNA polymerase specialized sigma24 family protein